MADLLDIVSAAIDRVEGTEILVGIQGEPAKEPHEESDTTVLEVAKANHWGTERAPSRPWLLQASNEYGRSWLKAWRHVAALESDAAYDAGLRQIAVVAVSDAKRALVDLDDPPNAEATIERKGSDNPLVDTSQLVNSHRAKIVTPGKPDKVVA